MQPHLMQPIMENQVEKKMENEMETGIIGPFGGVPIIRIIRKVC